MDLQEKIQADKEKYTEGMTIAFIFGVFALIAYLSGQYQVGLGGQIIISAFTCVMYLFGILTMGKPKAPVVS